MIGVCGGAPRDGSSNAVQGKARDHVATRVACQAFCDAALACVGYSYSAHDRRCYVHGRGVNILARNNPGDGWDQIDGNDNTIVGIATLAPHSANYGGGADTPCGLWWHYVCVAVAGRN
jgi:hypothetical protein